MKNNLEYYQHYAQADQHPKFKALRVKYGWQGEGRFWALNNRIAISEMCILDLGQPRNKASVASDLGLSIPKFDEFIEFLSSDHCDLLDHLGDGRYTTDVLQENLQAVTVQRSKAVDRRQRFRDRMDAHDKGSGELSQSSGEPSPALSQSSGDGTGIKSTKESKVKESKLKETKEDDVERYRQSYSDLEQFLLEAWGREGRVGRFILDDLLELGEKHGKEQLYEAIKTAARANVKNQRYVKGILERQKTETRPTGKPVTQTNAFIEVYCPKRHHIGTSLRRTDLEKNLDRSVTCKECGTVIPVRDILAKEKNGTASFAAEVDQ